MATPIMKDSETEQIMPGQVREMLGIDNVKIREMCKEADIRMKRNDRGLTYFTKDDVGKFKDLYAKSASLMSPPVRNNNTINGTNCVSNASVVRIVDTLRSIETSITEKLTSVLDEKLDGMDDVVMELIRVKTENETMRFKINELNKENYKLKKEVNSFKKVPFGFYAKTDSDRKLF